MYVATVPNRGSPPAILIRESYREGGKVKSRTIANISGWPAGKVAALREVLAGRGVPTGPAPRFADSFEIVSSQPHGHVAAVLGTLHRLGLRELIDPRSCHERDIVEALIAARILQPHAMPAEAGALERELQASSLGRLLRLQHVVQGDLDRALDWLSVRQGGTEKRLAKRHLRNGTLVLYELHPPHFASRFGLLANDEGCPVAVGVVESCAGEPMPLTARVRRLRKRFGVERVVLVGDRGILTATRSRSVLHAVDGLDWITSLRAPALPGRVLNGSPPLSLLGRQDLVELDDPRHRGERLIVCRRPEFADGRGWKRAGLPAALDGVSVLRTSVDGKRMSPAEVVRCYRSLSRVERAFRGLETAHRGALPSGARKEDRARAPVFLCMLAYHVEWHMRQALAPLLHGEEANEFPPLTFQSLLADLATIAINRVRPKNPGLAEFDKVTEPTSHQARTVELLRVAYRYRVE